MSYSFQIGAYCYAELGCMITKTGADYAYIMETFGSFLAFVRLWVECMIVRPCSQAIVALTFSVYALKPFFENCDPPDHITRVLAAVCISKSFLLLHTYDRYSYLVGGKSACFQVHKSAICWHEFWTFCWNIRRYFSVMRNLGQHDSLLFRYNFRCTDFHAALY